jgi:hypothetical protein
MNYAQVVPRLPNLSLDFRAVRDRIKANLGPILVNALVIATLLLPFRAPDSDPSQCSQPRIERPLPGQNTPMAALDHNFLTQLSGTEPPCSSVAAPPAVGKLVNGTIILKIP